VLDVERWAELRREHFVRGVSIKELMRRTGLARNTIRMALRSKAPTSYERSARPSKLDPFKEEIHELLRVDPKLPGVRVRELIEPLGFQGGKSIVDDYLREVWPMFLPRRSFQRTVYRPGEIWQWDLWEPSAHVPVGHGQLRRAWVVVACLGYSRAGAGALIFSKEAPDVLWGMTRCLWSLGALARFFRSEGRPGDRRGVQAECNFKKT
jgi:transposase